MHSERSLWATTRRNLALYGVLQRIESPIIKGIPDVVYCLLGHTGWLELKELDEWPKRATTTVTIKSLQLEQVLFMENWVRSRGAAHLLLQAERDYLLLDAETTRKIYARSITKLEIELSAVARGSSKFPTTAVVKALTR